MTQANDHYSRNSVREALRCWHQPKLLGDHPLAHTRAVTQRARLGRQAYLDTPAARGVALRSLLREAIEALRPDEPTPDFNNPQWRYYLILHRQYVKEQRAAQIQDVLGISESGYFKDQRRALDRLGAVLRERAAQLADTPSEEPPSLPSIFNVPLQPTPFIGRADELVQIGNLLGESACRLLVLIGPGGIGKTRLALEVAQQAVGQFTHGVAFVPLAPLHHPDLLAPAIAAAVQLALPAAGDALDGVTRFLQSRQMLLVLDNFEQLLAGADIVRHLLDHCPDLKLLVTSRFRLDLHGEWTLDIAGLTLPATADDPDFEQYAGIRLFLAAMRRVQPDAVLRPAERACVLALCRKLGGMPLGIELAASWLPLLPCSEIVAEIGRNVDFLASTLRDLPARHRSLRGVFDHSWELLSAPERQALQRLAVFAGSFTREAAEAVAYAERHPALLLLRTLKNKSMLRVDDSGRYTVQELLRQYAEEHLRADAAEWQATRDRHAAYFLGFLQERGQQLRGGVHQLRARRQLIAELDDVRSAWEWVVTQGQALPVRDAALALFLLYDLLNRLREGRAAFAQAAAVNWPDDTSTGRCAALLTLALRGYFEARLGEDAAAQQTFDAVLAALDVVAADARALIILVCLLANVPLPRHDPHALYAMARAGFAAQGDVWGEARTELAYGVWLRRIDAPDSKRLSAAVFRRALALHESLPDLWGVSKCLNYLGHIAYETGDYDAAERYGRRSLELFQELGDRLGMAYAFYSLGQVLGTRGAYAAAQQFYRDGLEIYRELGNARELADGLDSLGYVTYLRGDQDAAERYYAESLQTSRALGDRSGIGWSLHNLGDIARARGDFDGARALYQESHDMHLADNPSGWGRIVALDKLGRVTLAAGDHAAARHYHVQALQLAVQTNRPREATDALLALTQVVLAAGTPDELAAALVWLTLIVAHPATAQDTRRLADARRAELTARFAPAHAAALTAQGQTLTLAALLVAPPPFGPGQPINLRQSPD